MPTLTRIPINGQTFYIGGTPLDQPTADLAESDFSAYSWTEVKGWRTSAAVGDTRASIAVTEINSPRDFVIGGTLNGGTQEQAFNSIPGDAGQAAMLAAQVAGYNYPFKVVWPARNAPRSATVVVTIAAPGVFTWTAHGLAVDTAIKFTTTGALPTGLTANTVYFVKTVPTADTFTVSATVGGTAVTTSSTQSGTHTATTVPSGEERKFVGLVLSAVEQGGEVNALMGVTYSLAVNSNIVKKAALY